MKTYGKRSTVILKDEIKVEAKKSKITDYFAKRITNDENQPSAIDEKQPSTNHHESYKQSFRNDTRRDHFQQMFLDFGQRRGTLQECPECGMLYDRAIDSDRQQHRRTHAAWSECFKAHRYSKWIEWKWDHRDGDAIWRIAGCHCASLIKSVNQMMAAVSQDGIAKLQCFLYCHKGAVVGFMSVEDVRQAQSMDSDNGMLESKVISVNKGISRIWVHSDFRRKGIASKLLASLRNCHHTCQMQCQSSCTINPANVAFSQVTEDGKALALSFQGSCGIRIYKS